MGFRSMSTLKARILTALLVLAYLLPPPLSEGGGVKIVILYTNDLHGAVEPYHRGESMYGGLMLLSTLAMEIRESEDYTLLLDAGDFMMGEPLCDVYDGVPMVEAMNLMGYDVCTLGNHEFDKGLNVTAMLVRIAHAKFVCCNAYYSGNMSLIVEPYTIINMGGLRVGVIGVTTDALITLPALTGELTLKNPFTEVERYVSMLKEQVDLVVVLSHLGLNADRELASRVKGIDVIVGGHSGGPLAKPVLVDGTVIVQTEGHGKQLGKLVLYVGGGVTVDMDESCLLEAESPPTMVDERIREIVEKYRANISGFLSEHVGYAGKTLKRNDLCLLMADALRWYSGGDLGFYNMGGTRATIGQGEIDREDVLRVFPFPNTVVVIEVKGESLRKILSRYCFAGIKSEDMLANGSLIQDQAVYRVATCNYLLYRVRFDVNIEKTIFLNTSYADAFIRYVREIYGDKPIYGYTERVYQTTTPTPENPEEKVSLDKALMVVLLAVGIVIIVYLTIRIVRRRETAS